MVCLAEDRPSSRLLPNTLDLKYDGDSNNLPLKLLSHKKIKESTYLNSTQLHRLRRASQRNSQLILRNLFVCAVEKRVGHNQPGRKTKSPAALGKYHRLWRIWSPFLGFFSVSRTQILDGCDATVSEACSYWRSGWMCERTIYTHASRYCANNRETWNLQYEPSPIARNHYVIGYDPREQSSYATSGHITRKITIKILQGLSLAGRTLNSTTPHCHQIGSFQGKQSNSIYWQPSSLWGRNEHEYCV